MIKKNWISYLIVALLAPAAYGQVTCPPPPNQVIVHVTVNTAFDQTTKLFTYTYTVANDQSSAQDVVDVALDTAAPISDVKQPPNWARLRMGPTITAWFARGFDPTQPHNGGGLVPPLGRIKPGQSVTGFSFTSPHPPGGIKLWVKGFTDAPSGSNEQEAETAAADCPGQGDFFDVALNTSTTGPVIFIPVNIAIKPTAAPPVPINPRENGATPVAILGSTNYDVGQINLASLRLGPGNASPLSNQQHFEDVNGDGLPDLVVQFPSQQIGARCNDVSLFLTGDMNDGTPIQGTEAITTVGCESAKSAK